MMPYINQLSGIIVGVEEFSVKCIILLSTGITKDVQLPRIFFPDNCQHGNMFEVSMNHDDAGISTYPKIVMLN